MLKRILITGSAGFIGSSLKKTLIDKGIEVVSYDIKDNPLDDIRNFPNLKLKMQTVDGVVHLAAMSRVKWGFEDPMNCVKTNVVGTANVLQSARENGKPWVIFSSSREVFGEPKIFPVTEKHILAPINVYGVSKVAGEQLCKTFSDDYGLKTRVLRFSNVYTNKNDQMDRVTPKFILQASKNEDIFINGSGEEMFDFTYIKDTIDGVCGCIEEIEKSQKLYDDFILSTGKPSSLKNLAQIIIKTMASKSQIKYNEARSYDVNKFYADPKKAKQILGFNPSVELEEGIGLAVEELKKEKII